MLRNDCKWIANPKVDNWYSYDRLCRQSAAYKRWVKKVMRRRRRRLASGMIHKALRGTSE